MCETTLDKSISPSLNKSCHSKQQSHQNKLDKLLSRLPRLDEEYELEHKVGEGTFSSVYLGRSRLNPKFRVAVKHLIPTCHPARIARELKCMHHLGGEDNIVEVISCFRSQDCVVFVMPYQPHDKFSSYMCELNVRELQVYLRGLLTALKRVHAHNIIHRDVKPSNFLFHRKTQRFLLVDFGLAQNIEECANENGENFTSIKIELCEANTKKSTKVNEQSGQKKRKRDSLELQEGGIGQVLKRPALQPISNNITSVGREDLHNTKNSFLSKSQMSDHLPSRVNPLILSRSSPVFSKSSYLQGKELSKTSQQQALVVKRQPFNQSFSNISSIQTNNSFVRIQNSQVKLVGGLFAKPLPVSSSASLGSGSLTGGSSNLNKKCHCDGRPRVCNMCITRRGRAAPRAGTPGFRPPEVLLKYLNQTTAVDMWAVGVIMLSIMSSTYPFFRAPDDITALAELITIFGSDEMKALAKKLGRNIVCSEKRGPLDLQKLCEALRRRRCGGENNIAVLTTECHLCKMPQGDECLCPSSAPLHKDPRFPQEAYQLLSRFLVIDPDKRISAEDALKHSFFTLKL